jgi:uncharacterized cupin superfamily protein
MKTFRRVVTGHDAKGRAVFASDEQVPSNPLPGLPGTEICDLWGSDAVLAYPDDGSKPRYSDFFPPVGGCRFLVFTVPPDNAVAAEQSSPDALQAAAPSLAATMQADAPGMHRSDTIDMLYVISGRCVLELDAGARIELAAGDTAIQSGTMHAWRNPFDEPCRVIAALVGAERR